MVGQLVADMFVSSLGGLIDQAEEEAVHGTGGLQVRRVTKFFMNGNVCNKISIHAICRYSPVAVYSLFKIG